MVGDVVKPTGTRLYIGVALYKIGEPSKNEPDWMVNGGVPELKKQLDLNESMPQIQGTILFRENYLNQPQTQQAVNYLKSRWGSRAGPSLSPTVTPPLRSASVNGPTVSDR